jgi:hypothetical protein
MATMDELYPRKLDIGRVLQRTVWALGRQPAMILGLSLVLSALPTAYSLYSLRGLMDLDGYDVFTRSPLFWGHSLFGMFIHAFFQATVFAVVIGELGGRTATAREVLATGGKFFLPLFAVNLLFVLGFVGGLILLIVPGVMLALAWFVVGPTLMVERTGITQVFARSAELTRNNRWRLLGLAAIYCVAKSILGDSPPTMMWHVHGPMEVMDWVFSPIRIGIRAVLSGIFNGIALTGLAVTYVELRTLREGAEPADLDQVFT